MSKYPNDPTRLAILQDYLTSDLSKLTYTPKSFRLETFLYYPSNRFVSYWKLFSSIR